MVWLVGSGGGLCGMAYRTSSSVGGEACGNEAQQSERGEEIVREESGRSSMGRYLNQMKK